MAAQREALKALEAAKASLEAVLADTAARADRQAGELRDKVGVGASVHRGRAG